eukprot:745280-Rhodomonas_salina.1
MEDHDRSVSGSTQPYIAPDTGEDMQAENTVEGEQVFNHPPPPPALPHEELSSTGDALTTFFCKVLSCT